MADLLVADESNPRAVAFQLAALEEHLAQLPREVTHPQRSPDRQTALRIRSHIKLADLRNVCLVAKRGVRPGLHVLMNDIVDAMNKISEIVSQIYFSHGMISRSLQEFGEERPR